MSEVFTVSMVAPSRVGKTSLVTAVLSNAQDLLAGKPFSIKPKNAQTNAKIQQQRNDLDGAIFAGEFDAGAMSGTQEPFWFDFTLKNSNASNDDFDIQFLDFPGGWLQQMEFAEGATQKKCAQFMRESSALMLVVDAALVMEALSPAHQRAIASIMDVQATLEVVRDWAKNKAKTPDAPALLMVCPVKCESYFNDNGGRKDLSQKLYDVVMGQLYKDLAQIIRDEQARQAEILYIPVDTFGCVDFVSAKWESAGRGVSFNPHFKVRANALPAIVGGGDVLIAIAKQVMRQQQARVEKAHQEAKHRADQATQKATENKWFYEKVLTTLFDYETDEEKDAAKRRAAADQAKAKASSVKQVLQQLAAQPHGKRVRVIPNGE